MKIVVMSDSHGNVDFVRRVIGIARNEKADFIIYLGDDSADVKDFNAANVIIVPGVYEREYQDKTITDMKNRIVKGMGELHVLISHTRTSHANDIPEDMKPEELVAKRAVDVVLFGHTHLYSVEIEDGILFVNPGHLKAEDKKGRPATYAVLYIEGRNVRVRIVGVDGKQHVENSFLL